MICSFPRQVDSQIFDDLYRRAAKWSWSWCRRAASRRGSERPAPGWGRYLPHRLRHAAGGRQGTREIDGRHYVLEYPIKADFALIKALTRGDRWGNLGLSQGGAQLWPDPWRQRRNHHRRGLAAGGAGRPRPGKHHHPRHFSSSASSRWKT